LSCAISIVVPVHGHAALTRRCLDKVLAELSLDCELIVVDDASTDSTPELLAGYGEAIRAVSLARNGGYANACNQGSRDAKGELLIFLNNDTEPQSGWADALVRHAAGHPAAAVVGAKLVYPTGAVQHAGVSIGQDGYPHNLYAGFPADHPAVDRPRRLQAVTGACMLVRRDAFEAAGGFDTGFVNSLEDVDLCLRIGEAGGEIHYCPESLVVHLESASRGRRNRFERSVALYRERWRGRARRDDLSLYAEDGLIEVEYTEAHPLRISISPLLANLDLGRDGELEQLLETYPRQVSDLMGEVVRLSALIGEGAAEASRGWAEPAVPLAPGFDHQGFVAEANRLEEEVLELQRRLEGAAGSGSGSSSGFTASRRLGYRRLVERIRESVEANVPPGAAVLVVSRGDRELVQLDGIEGQHFPQDPGGHYRGHHPRDGADAVEQLEQLRGAGAQYLVLPATAYWWLEHYDDFAQHLHGYPRTDAGVCAIFRLDAEHPSGRRR
jgi:GT2 family glycosyltransferase